MNRPQHGTLRVPGAQLAYDVRGSGPSLLLIAGGSGNSAAFAGLVGHLVEHYRVITYDRRGGGKSTSDAAHQDSGTDARVGTSTDMSIERHADDALALLEALTTEPAFVFGSSAGGLVGLDLLTRYPDRVRLLLAHEPTVPSVLPAFDQSQARHLDTFYQHGEVAAALALAAENAPGGDQPEARPAPSPDDMRALAASVRPLFEYTIPAILQYRPDLAALAALRNRIALGGSTVGRVWATPVYQATAALAQRLGSEVIEFPGDHVGCIAFPAEHATLMRSAFSAPNMTAAQ